MKLLVISVILMILFASQLTAQTNTSVVEGIVTRTGTSEPLAGVRVVLMGGDTAKLVRILLSRSANLPLSMDTLLRQVTTPIPESLGLVTDDAGHFLFKDVPAGEYLVGAEREGYWALDSVGGGASTVSTQQIVIVSLQPTPKLAFSLSKAVTVRGHVIDAKGQPIPNIAVAAFRIVYQFDGRAALSLAAGNPSFTNAKTTNDLGEYRVFGLAPGDYYIGTTTQRGIDISDPQKRYSVTYYPNVVDARKARTVSLREGDSLSGIDIEIQAISPSTITGQVIDRIPTAINTRPGAASFSLVPHDPEWLTNIAGTSFLMRNALTDPGELAAGKFEIRGVFPGSYDLLAQVGSDIRGLWFLGRTRVEVFDRSVENVKITAQTGVDLRVRLNFNGPPSGIPLDTVRVEMYPLEIFSAPFYTMLHPGETLSPRRRVGDPAPPPLPFLDATGAFSFSRVAEGRYQIAVRGLPEDVYIADIRNSSESIYDNGLVVAAESPGEIQIAVDRNGGTIEGDVQDLKQRQFSNANVVLVPTMSRRVNLSLYKTAIADAQGHFALRGIAPGEYKLFAWENLPTYAYLNSDFIAKYESSGQLVHIESGVRVAPPPLKIISTQ